MNSRFVVLASLAFSLTGAARAGTFSQTFTVSTDITDSSSTGLLNVQNVTLADPVITGLSLDLSIDPSPGKSAFLGDLFAYVEHNGKTTVLLNRPGRTDTALGGYADNQAIHVSFSDAAPDIHGYRITPSTPLATTLTGTWGPDGRASDPSSAAATDARTLLLSGFIGENANGNWSLFVADLSGGGEHRLLSWKLDLTTTAVPEPQVWVGACGLLAWAGFRLRRLHRRATRS